MFPATENLSHSKLSTLLIPHLGRSAWPGLDDPQQVRAVADRLRRAGLWNRVLAGVKPGPIPAQRFSDTLEFERSGSRDGASTLNRNWIAHQIEATALGLWLDHPQADALWLEDLIWAYCEWTSWVPPEHAYCNNDLFSTTAAALLAEIHHLLGERLHANVRERMKAEILRRVLDPALDPKTMDWWTTADMNWNSVCNANLIRIALSLIDNPYRLSVVLRELILRLPHFLAGFPEDGACLEGTGYWAYGFGFYVDAAYMIDNRTGGELNLMQGEKIRRICEFPIAAHVENQIFFSFSDAAKSTIQPELVARIQHFQAIPELLQLALSPAKSLQSRFPKTTPRVAEFKPRWHSLVVPTPPVVRVKKLSNDAFLPDIGFVKLRQGKGSATTTLCALAGNNGFPHNHNDIGTFAYYRNGVAWLTDPGGPIYTAKTFGPKRYEIIQCRSLGHSVPYINNTEQSPGKEYRGTIEPPVEADGCKRVQLDLTGAYPKKANLQGLKREFELHPDGKLGLRDIFHFPRKPRALEEIFVTYETARVSKEGVRLGAKGEVLLCAHTPGRFDVEDLGEESRTWHKTTTLKRIRFTPASLQARMELLFLLQPRAARG